MITFKLKTLLNLYSKHFGNSRNKYEIDVFYIDINKEVKIITRGIFEEICYIDFLYKFLMQVLFISIQRFFSSAENLHNIFSHVNLLIIPLYTIKFYTIHIVLYYLDFLIHLYTCISAFIYMIT